MAIPRLGSEADIKDRVDGMLGVIEHVKLKPTNEAIGEAIAQALATYNDHQPRERIFESPGDGATKRYVLTETLAPGWIRGSSVLSVSTVADANTNDEVDIPYAFEDWRTRRDASDQDILQLCEAVPNGKTLRVVYTTLHEIGRTNADETTVEPRHAEGVVSLVAANVARWVSSQASDIKDQQIGAGLVDYSGLAREWMNRERGLRDHGMRLITTTAEEVESGATADGAASVELVGRDRLLGYERVSH